MLENDDNDHHTYKTTGGDYKTTHLLFIVTTALCRFPRGGVKILYRKLVCSL